MFDLSLDQESFNLLALVADNDGTSLPKLYAKLGTNEESERNLVAIEQENEGGMLEGQGEGVEPVAEGSSGDMGGAGSGNQGGGLHFSVPVLQGMLVMLET